MQRTGTILLLFSALAWCEIATDQRIEMYERLLAQKPGTAEYQCKLAEAFLQKTRETGEGKYLDKASALIERALAADSKDYRALRVRNLIGMQRHDFATVVQTARQLEKIAPDDAQNLGILGDALMEMGQYDAAAEAYGKMIRRKPDMFSYNREAWRKFVIGDATGAISMMKDATATARGYPENKAWCLVELGNLYFKTGKIDDAGKAYAQAIEVFPRMHSAHAGTGAVLAARGEIAKAIESYRKAQQTTPLVQYAGALADLYAVAGNAEESRKQMDLVDVTARLEKAQNVKAHRALSLIYSNQDRNLDEALALAKADLDVRKDVYTWDAYAWALYKNKKFKEAWMVGLQALRADTPEPLFHYHMGMIYFAMSRPVEAKQELEKAMALNPKFDARQALIAEKTLAQLKSAK